MQKEIRMLAFKYTLYAGFLSFLTALLIFPMVCSAGEKKPKPEEWQIKGAIAGFNDPDIRVRVLALDKLRELNALDKIKKDKIAELLKYKGRDLSVRNSAVSALGAMQAKEYAPKIIEMLKDGNWFIPDSAASALASMQAKEYAPKIAEMLKDENTSVRNSAVSALGSIQAKEYAPKIAEMLKDEDSDIRDSAIEALGSMQAKEYAPKIAEMLKDGDWVIRNSAVSALGSMQAKEYAPKIIEMLKDGDSDIRDSAIEALGSMQAKEYAPKIIEMLKDGDSGIRYFAVSALGSMQAKEYAPKIIKMLKDEDSDIRDSAIEALGSMQAKEYAPKIIKMLKDEDSDIRDSAIEALGSIQAKEYAPKIAEMLKDENTSVRNSAVSALGSMQAKEYAPKIAEMLKDENTSVRNSAVSALGSMQAKEYAPKIAEMLKDKDFLVRNSAVSALGSMQAKEYAPKIAEILKDGDSSVRDFAIEALSSIQAKGHPPKIVEVLPAAFALIDMQAKEYAPKIMYILRGGYYGEDYFNRFAPICPLDAKSIIMVLDPIYDDPAQLNAKNRFIAHYLGGGESEAEIAIRWLGEPSEYPKKISHAEGIDTLLVFDKIWETSKDLPKLRLDLERQIASVVGMVSWDRKDIGLLKLHQKNLESASSTQSALIEKVILSLEGKRWFSRIYKILIIHSLFWILLILIYPKSSKVQAIFFWNKWFMWFAGFGYVSLALILVPFLRRRLFTPFKESLLSDASLNNFKHQAYFEDSEVEDCSSNKLRLIKEVISDIKGQIILEGSSGLGKTMFIQHLLSRSKRIVVFLPARKCDKGVIEAIQEKLHGPAKGTNFLQSLIYIGAIDICIDGLNEVTADTRIKVINFVEGYPKINIIITTQPLEWIPPSTAKKYIVQPLNDDKIRQFLISRKDILPEDAKVIGAEYEQNCQNYLEKALDKNQSEEVLDSARKILSNPMDLTFVSDLIARKQNPDLFHLLKQQYNIMASDYEGKNNSEFPLDSFSEEVYQMRLNDAYTISDDKFIKELQCMERYKMVLCRKIGSPEDIKQEWIFRHDKIMEYFIVQTFLGTDNTKPEKHIDDPRFRGVYFLMAMLMPIEDAEALRECLINYAADTKDHTVSDPFIQLLRARKVSDQ